MRNNCTLMGIIMTTDTDSKRFSAMKQLFDIGIKILKNPDYIVQNDEFTDADKGMVCLYPDFVSDGQYKILYQKNADEKASTMSAIKLMTVLTGIPYISSICSEQTTIQKEDIFYGSGNFFDSGDVLTIEDLLYGMLLPSSNTCAAAFARYVGSKILNDIKAPTKDCLAAFYKEMNRRAKIIGCQHNNFISVSGLNFENYSTPSDMMKILFACTAYPEITNIWNKKTYTVNIKGDNPRSVDLHTTVQNKELEKDYFILGGKTGSAGTGTLRSLAMIARPVLDK